MIFFLCERKNTLIFICIKIQSDKTALHIAAEEGHLDAVMRLIDLRCDVNKRDKVLCGYTLQYMSATAS